LAVRASIPVTLRVRAVNSAGIGEWSAESEAIAISGPPSEPKVVAVTADSDELIVEWLRPEQDGGHEVMLYELFTREQSEGDWKPLAIVSIESVMYDPRDAQKVSATIPAMPAGVHRFKLRACNSAGAGDFAEWDGELSVRATLPSAPLGVAVSATTLGDQAELSWWLPRGAGGGLDVTAYHVEVTCTCARVHTSHTRAHTHARAHARAHTRECACARRCATFPSRPTARGRQQHSCSCGLWPRRSPIRKSSR
jgi:hypothetical protein